MNAIRVMRRCTRLLPVVCLLLWSPSKSEAQDELRLYFNAGYVTNLEKCPECEKADTGGSIRAGIFTSGRWGFYAGYLWFKEHHPPTIDYEDKGSVLLAGIDFRFLRTGSVDWYAQVGMAREKFISTYPNRTETETNFIPDLGLLLGIGHFNALVAWQPSDPFHINLGVGVTL